jgi:hypothetical protein
VYRLFRRESLPRPGGRKLVGLQVESARYFHLLLTLAREIAGATRISVTPEEVSRHENLIQHCDLIVADTAIVGVAKVATLSAVDRDDARS